MATNQSSSKSGKSRSASTADNQGPDPADEAREQLDQPGVDLSDDIPTTEATPADDGVIKGTPHPDGTVKVTGELVTDDTMRSAEQARRNAGLEPTSGDYAADDNEK